MDVEVGEVGEDVVGSSLVVDIIGNAISGEQWHLYVDIELVVSRDQPSHSKERDEVKGTHVADRLAPCFARRVFCERV